MLKNAFNPLVLFLFNFIFYELGYFESCFAVSYLKVNIYMFLTGLEVCSTLFFIYFLSSSFNKISVVVAAVVFNFTLYHSLLKNSTLLSFLSLCVKSFIIFVIVVVIRVATPRFKIESLTKIGWLYCLLFLLVCLLMFVSGYFFF